MKSITVIIPVYNEVESLKELHKELTAVLSGNDNYELLFVDDGSSDGSINILNELSNSDYHTKVIQFYRNYGKAAALAEGFKVSSGDYVVTMDADLQDDPAEIPNLVAKLEEGYDLVSGWKKTRHDPWTKRWPSKFANIITRLMTGVKIHDMNCGLKIYKQSVVKSLDVYGGRHRYIPALAGQKKFKVGEVAVNHRHRKFGVTKYGGSRLFHGFFDLITILFLNRYTQRPLHLFGFFGLLCVLSAIVLESTAVYYKLLLDHPFQKHFALIVFGAMVFVLGLWFFSIGLIAEMITANQQGKEDRVKRIIGNSAD
ncbi:MAG: glycosyltransferase [Candidatus Marinimicrobia bacterium]|jgi:glycosyltransferase involved in cell wall biosynthesis|nr:glycosyltransferase [Candidatus Neomarinimicrobiota bacterium]|tara:strand:- start:941 stop:1879 length:939 start_codon:yes stop_codon:yes gene_type:complete